MTVIDTKGLFDSKDEGNQSILQQLIESLLDRNISPNCIVWVTKFGELNNAVVNQTADAVLLLNDVFPNAYLRVVLTFGSSDPLPSLDREDFLSLRKLYLSMSVCVL
jgi:hypothetical protein